MFGLKTTTEDKTKDVARAAEKAQYRNFFHAAASVSRTAKESIDKADGPSAPGSPPHTHKRVFLRRAIRCAANKQGAIIGPIHSVVGHSAEAHEFGGIYKSTRYPERPFMRPALDKAAPRFAGSWQGSIGR